jgi:hypothetical protein
MSTVVVLQSCFLPWRGYFDLIRRADHFVFLDSVQYTVRDWRNRNRFASPIGVRWLSVPVHAARNRSIRETLVDNSREWGPRMFQTLRQWYGKARDYPEFEPFLRETLAERRWETISELNRTTIRQIAARLGYTTQFHEDIDLIGPEPDRNLRILNLVKAVGGTAYLTGPKGMNYLDPARFAEAGITVRVMEYPDYPAYSQFWGVSDPALSILDLLLHQGGDAPNFIGDSHDPL